MLNYQRVAFPTLTLINITMSYINPIITRTAWPLSSWDNPFLVAIIAIIGWQSSADSSMYIMILVSSLLYGLSHRHCFLCILLEIRNNFHEYSLTISHIFCYIIWAIGKTSIEKCDLRVKVIVFGSSLYRFTAYPDCIICIPWQTACGKPFYTCTSASEACLTALRFLLRRSNCMVWYVNATANHSCTILSQTQKQVWIQLLEEVWMSSHSDMLRAFLFTPQRLGSKPSPWSNAFALAIFI